MTSSLFTLKARFGQRQRHDPSKGLIGPRPTKVIIYCIFISLLPFFIITYALKSLLHLIPSSSSTVSQGSLSFCFYFSLWNGREKRAPMDEKIKAEASSRWYVYMYVIYVMRGVRVLSVRSQFFFVHQWYMYDAEHLTKICYWII